ncbi:MAG: CNNM domain-containing protein [Bacteroidales bacterium]
MVLLITYLTLAIAVSFLCSIMEAVILSVSMSFLQTRANEGSHQALKLIKMKNNIDRPLAAILSINTVAHTVGAAGVGAQAVAVFGEAYFGLISAVLTLLILIFSEIIPKTIGARYWRQMALPSAAILQGLIYISYPLVLVSKWITRLISTDDVQATVSREEIAAMASLAKQEGVFEESELKVISNLVRLRTIKIRQVMTPRTVLLAAPENLTLTEFFKNKDYLHHSRIPIYHENIDNITGYVLKYDVLEKLADDHFDMKLKDIRREMLITYENFSIPLVFEQLLESKKHIALIVDEYGGVEGIVTLEDIFETLLGLEITDETDSQIDMQKHAREKWWRRARRLNIRPSDIDLPEEQEDDEDDDSKE